MANGCLGKSMSVANTNVNVYSVPATAQYVTATVNIANTSSNDVTVRVAVSTSASPAVGDYVEYNTVIPGNGQLIRSCELYSASENIFVYASTSDLAIRVTGLEQM